MQFTFPEKKILKDHRGFVSFVSGESCMRGRIWLSSRPLDVLFCYLSSDSHSIFDFAMVRHFNR
jgi:hypothetical protein